MRTTSHISAIALASALLATSPAAHAQLLGLDLGLGQNDDGGLGVDLGVNVGGQNGINLDTGVNVGGSSAVGVDANVNAGGSDNLNVGAEVLPNPRSGGSGGSSSPATNAPIIDVNVNSTPRATTGGTASMPTSTQTITGQTRLSALDRAARGTALVGLIGNPNLADIDLDASINDRRVIITEVGALLGEDSLADIDAALELGGSGRDQLRDSISASDILRSILGNEGIAIEDVLAVQVGDDGATEIIVLPRNGEAGQRKNTGIDLGELADLDIDALTDEELAEVDLTLLPQEEQRLNAVLRLLGTEPTDGAGDGSQSDTVQVIDLDALLGEQSLAEVDAILGEDDAEVIQLDATLLGALEEQGIDPETIVALRVGPTGLRRLFVADDRTDGSSDGVAVVTLNLGEGADGGTGDDAATGNLLGDLADLDIDALTDEELAEIDLTLLPEEEQRLNAVLRLLGTDATDGSGGDGTDSDTIEVVNLDVLLGEQSLAEVDAILGGEDAEAVQLDATLLGALEGEGIDPQTIAAVRVGPTGLRRLFVTDDDGANDGSSSDVALLTLNIGGGTAGDDDDGGQNGGAGGDDDGDGTDGNAGNGNGTGGNGDGSGGGDDDDGTSNGGGGTGVGSDDGTDVRDDAAGNAGAGGTAVGGGGTGGTPAGGAATPVQAAAIDPVNVTVTDVSCGVGLTALIEGSDAEPEDVTGASMANLVGVTACEDVPEVDDIADIRAAIDAHPVLPDVLDAAGHDSGDVIGATVEDGELVLYLNRSTTNS